MISDDQWWSMMINDDQSSMMINDDQLWSMIINYDPQTSSFPSLPLEYYPERPQQLQWEHWTDHFPHHYSRNWRWSDRLVWRSGIIMTVFDSQNRSAEWKTQIWLRFECMNSEVQPWYCGCGSLRWWCCRESWQQRSGDPPADPSLILETQTWWPASLMAGAREHTRLCCPPRSAPQCWTRWLPWVPAVWTRPPCWWTCPRVRGCWSTCCHSLTPRSSRPSAPWLQWVSAAALDSCLAPPTWTRTYPGHWTPDTMIISWVMCMMIMISDDDEWCVWWSW